MSFDIENVVKDMLAAAQTGFAEEWPNVKDGMEQVLANEKEALWALSVAYMAGQIDERELRSQLESEREVLAAGVAMVNVSNRVAVQRALNGAMRVLEGAVRAAI